MSDFNGSSVWCHPEDVHQQDPEVHAAQSGGFGEGDFGVGCVGWVELFANPSIPIAEA